MCHIQVTKTIFVLGIILCINILQVNAEPRTVFDYGVDWEGDYFVNLPTRNIVVDSPYVYIFDNYGVRFDKISSDGDSTWIEYRSITTAEHVTENCVLDYTNNLLAWGRDLIYIAERTGDSLDFQYSGYHRGTEVYSITADSILIHSDGLWDLHDPEEPSILWEHWLSKFTIIVEDRLFTLSGDEIEVYDISEPENINILDSVEVEGYWNYYATNSKPVRIGNTIAFFHEAEEISFVYLDDNLNITGSYHWDTHPDSRDDEPGDGGVINDSLFYLIQYIDEEQSELLIHYFHPDSLDENMNIANVTIPWGNHTSTFFFCPVGKSSLLFKWGYNNAGGPERKILYDFSDFLQPEEVFSTPERFPRGAYSSAQCAHENHLVLTQKDSSDADLLWRIYDLYTGDIPEIYLDLPDSIERVQSVYDTIFSVNTTDELGNNIIGLYSTSGDSIRFLYALPNYIGGVDRQFYHWNNILFLAHWIWNDEIRGIKVFTCNDNGTLLLQMIDNRISPYCWGGNGLFAFNNEGTKLYSYRFNYMYELDLVDSLSLEGITLPLYYSNGILAAGQYLIEDNNKELNILHTYDSILFRNGVQETSFSYPYYLVRSNNNDLYVFDISSESYDDTTARIFYYNPSGNANLFTHITGDTLWAGAKSRSLNKYVFTGLHTNEIVLNDDAGFIPDGFSLEPAYPNPFNSTTSILFSLPLPGVVHLSVYDILGRKVTQLLDRPMSPGNYQIPWRGNASGGSTISSGTYFITLEADRFKQTRKIILLK
ncbi:MAG: T9SS type A sorting domain-containing protein [Candidatus Electryonea clarkiae]|nr:T9SS type A sorting domain-containing protein [Candidatus Electryonea clarkiae]MDP8285111.1 T9SS type A sorting domain-containing protein [Candidatus Electryonea clarkiae]